MRMELVAYPEGRTALAIIVIADLVGSEQKIRTHLLRSGFTIARNTSKDSLKN
jgi:hypothetical protein